VDLLISLTRSTCWRFVLGCNIPVVAVPNHREWPS